MPTYHAKHYRRFNPRETIARRIGKQVFEARDDPAAFEHAMASFKSDYNVATDRIHIVELREPDEPRHVWIRGND